MFLTNRWKNLSLKIKILIPGLSVIFIFTLVISFYILPLMKQQLISEKKTTDKGNN